MSSSTPAVLSLEQVAIFHHQRQLLEVTADIEPGQILTIMGPSGAGKSMLLAGLAGVLPADFSLTGQVVLGQTRLNQLPAYQRQLGLLYQDPLLFEHLNVEQNIAFGMPRGSDRRTIIDDLAQVGLAAMASQAVQHLSGGQQARVALLRTLAAQPRAILLDEPFSKLDTQTRAQTRQWVFSQITRRQLPVILVTHDAQDAEAANGPIIEVAPC